jgi:imidazolonepropionase-like amidohydrolase
MGRWVCLLVYLLWTSAVAAEGLVLKNARVLTITHGTIEKGAVRVENGLIAEVGETVDERDAKVVDLGGQVLMPGLIDTHSHVGISNRPGGTDTNERSGPVQPGLRALDAIYPQDATIRMATAGGVTTGNIMPGSGNVMGGQTAYVKYRGETIDEMLIDKGGITGGMKMANGENPKRGYGSRNKAPDTRMAVAALQREVFVKARNYREAWKKYEETGEGKAPERDLGMEAMLEVLDGKRIVHFHTHRADDIMTAIRLSEEFGFRLVLQHVSEGFKVAKEIARHDVPCSIIVIDAPGGKLEAINLLAKNAAALKEAGVTFAFHTDDSITDSRWFLRSAALAVRAGLDRETALRALTINAANMIDLGDRIGSIEAGKQADLVVLTGDPLSVYTHVAMTFIEGRKVFDRSNAQDRLYAVGGFAIPERYPPGESM